MSIKPKEVSKTRQKSPNFLIPILVILVIALCGGMFFTYKLGEKRGLEEGYEKRETETSEALQKIASLLTEKLTLQEKTKDFSSNSPETLSSESIDSFISQIASLKDSSSLESVKENFDKLVEALNSFRAVYETKNNSLIEEKFEELKTDISSLESSINDLYNQEIESALNSLKSEN